MEGRRRISIVDGQEGGGGAYESKSTEHLYEACTKPIISLAVWRLEVATAVYCFPGLNGRCGSARSAHHPYGKSESSVTKTY